MNTIKIDLPAEIQQLKLVVFADEHIGDKHSDEKRILDRIKAVRDEQNTYCIMNGDLMNNATCTSISDTYSETLMPMQQLQRCEEIFSPIADKILAITQGNHEIRSYRKEGIDLTALMARQLGIEDRYSQAGALIFLRFGECKKEHPGVKQTYIIYALHGSGGGRKEGAKVIRLADMASIVDADIYLHAHTHLPIVMKQSFFRTSISTSSVAAVDKLFVNTAANLSYGGYGEAQEFKPSSMAQPIILLDGTKRNMTATL